MTKDSPARRYFNSTIQKIGSRRVGIFFGKWVKSSKSTKIEVFRVFPKIDRKKVEKKVKKRVKKSRIWPWRPFNKYVFRWFASHPYCRLGTSDAENTVFRPFLGPQKSTFFRRFFDLFFVIFDDFWQISKNLKSPKIPIFDNFRQISKIPNLKIWILKFPDSQK